MKDWNKQKTACKLGLLMADFMRISLSSVFWVTFWKAWPSHIFNHNSGSTPAPEMHKLYGI